VTHAERYQRRKRAIDLYHAGRSLAEIARETGLAQSTADNAIRASVGSASWLQPYVRRSVVFRAIAMLQNERLSANEVARRLSVSRQRIGQIVRACREAGVDLPRSALTQCQSAGAVDSGPQGRNPDRGKRKGGGL
jgi:transposase